MWHGLLFTLNDPLIVLLYYNYWKLRGKTPTTSGLPTLNKKGAKKVMYSYMQIKGENRSD
jgi:hypothetical protein